MSRAEEKLEGALMGLVIAVVIIAAIVMLVLYVAAWAILAALVLGIVWGCVKYMICAHSKKTVIKNIRQRGGPGAARALATAHYSVVEDADLQMDIWLNSGIGDYVAPGDDVRPGSSYGFVRFASWPFLIRWIPCLAYLVFTAFLRVGFLVCFGCFMARLGLGMAFNKLREYAARHQIQPEGVQ